MCYFCQKWDMRIESMTGNEFIVMQKLSTMIVIVVGS
jgi:hypothetical protein